MKNNKSVHIALDDKTFKKIEEWKEVYGLTTTACIRLALKTFLSKI